MERMADSSIASVKGAKNCLVVNRYVPFVEITSVNNNVIDTVQSNICSLSVVIQKYNNGLCFAVIQQKSATNQTTSFSASCCDYR